MRANIEVVRGLGASASDPIGVTCWLGILVTLSLLFTLCVCLPILLRRQLQAQSTSLPGDPAAGFIRSVG
jgi:hypothetical protein